MKNDPYNAYEIKSYRSHCWDDCEVVGILVSTIRQWASVNKGQG